MFGESKEKEAEEERERKKGGRADKGRGEAFKNDLQTNAEEEESSGCRGGGPWAGWLGDCSR